MYLVYVLFSPSYNKIYIGFTSNLEQRMLSHNVLGKKGWTIKFRPWEIIFTEEYKEKSDAMQREKELKGAINRRKIWDLINEKYHAK